jgi:mitotic spindle assembly checkpoint protein MAD2B
VSNFPVWPEEDVEGEGHEDKDKDVEVEGEEEDEDDEELSDDDAEEEEEEELIWEDVNESLRGALGRLASAAETMPRLPDGCPFTLAIELRSEAPPPIDVSWTSAVQILTSI